MISVSFIGVGNRGSVYAKYFHINSKAKIVSACDIERGNLEIFTKEYGVENCNVFVDENEFFKQKRSDVLVIATLDKLHLRHAVKALQLGYDLLLEKPVAPNLEDTETIINTAKKYGRSVVICHNLRYTPFYQTFKTLINDGVIGDIVSVEQAENVSFWHFLTSFVRGNWCREEETSPIILQKCCHDLDIINWLVGKKCEKLSSFGGLRFYCEESAPDYSVKRCVDCDKTDCTYNAVNIYTRWPKALSVPKDFDKSKENVKAFLSDEKVRYGNCAFHGVNDVCDRQVVNMRFEGGVTASLLMHGFCADKTDRNTYVFGTKGCLEGNLESGKITVTVYGKEPCVVDVNAQITDKESHSGGDSKLVYDYVEYMNGAERPLGISLIEDSLYSHKLAFKAEESRLLGGKDISVER